MSTQENTISVPLEPAAQKPIWILLLAGTPINSFEELVKAAKDEELWDGEEKSDVLKTIWDARLSVDPEGKIETLVESEPLLLYAIDYKRNEKEDGVDPIVFANSGKSISDIIVKATAGILLNGELSRYFTYLENGEIIINPDNPPTMDHGHELIRRILTIKDTGKKIENYSSWTLGMVSDMLETYFGGAYDPTIVMDATGVAYNTYSTSLNVFRNCWHTRRPSLTFTHHKEVFYANIQDDQKELALDLAEKLKLNVANLRKLLSYIRHYGQEAIKIDEIKDEDDLIQLINVRSANRNFMFLIPNENKWYKFKGEYEMIPRNASVVINLETKAVIREEGPVPIEDWAGANLTAATPGAQPRRRARRRTRREILRDAQLQQDVVEAQIDSAEENPFAEEANETPLMVEVPMIPAYEGPIVGFDIMAARAITGLARENMRDSQAALLERINTLLAGPLPIETTQDDHSDPAF